jgi:hypothetical protein
MYQMEEVLKMSPKERERKAIFEMVKRVCLTLKQAARQSNLSYRQTRRVRVDDAGLIHKNRDQQSNDKKCSTFNGRIIMNHTN